MKLHIHGLFAKNFRKIGRAFFIGKIGEIICALRENNSMRDRTFGKGQLSAAAPREMFTPNEMFSFYIMN